MEYWGHNSNQPQLHVPPHNLEHLRYRCERSRQVHLRNRHHCHNRPHIDRVQGRLGQRKNRHQHHRRLKRQNTTDHEQRLRDIFNQVEQLNDHVEQLLHKYCDDPSSTVLTLPPTPPRPSKRKQHHTIGRKQQHGCYYRNSHGMKKVTLMARSA